MKELKIFGLPARRIAFWLAIAFVGSAGLLAIVTFAADIPGRAVRGEYETRGSRVQDINVDESGTYPAAGIRDVVIDTSFEDVVIVSTGGDEVGFRYFGRLWRSRDASSGLIESEVIDGQWIITTLPGVVAVSGGTMKLEVTIPRDGLDLLSVAGSSGDIAIRGAEAKELVVDFSSGDITVEGFRGTSVNLDGSSGDLRADGLVAAEGRFDGSSGEMRMTGLDLEDAVFSASSGDITLSFDRAGSSVAVETSSGEVALIFPSGSGLDVDVDTASGDIRSTFPVSMTGAISKREISGRIGEGGTKISVSTASGDIRLTEE